MDPNPAVANEPLDFNFLKSPPGELVLIETHRLHINCRGSGKVTVVFEAGLGGSALEFNPVVDLLGSDVSTCVYDRGGYGWSDRSIFPAHASRRAAEINQLLDAAGIHQPLLLVGHSFGGLVSRLFADVTENDVVGMVLIDSSHEDQITKFEALGGASLVPTGDNFVMRGSGVPKKLPRDLYGKIDAMSRLRKTYDATHSEISNFRLSVKQVKENREVFDFPVKVIMRGISPYPDDDTGNRKATIWAELQQDLTKLATKGELIVAKQSGHHIHVDEPNVIKQAITELLYGYEQK